MPILDRTFGPAHVGAYDVLAIDISMLDENGGRKQRQTTYELLFNSKDLYRIASVFIIMV